STFAFHAIKMCSALLPPPYGQPSSICPLQLLSTPSQHSSLFDSFTQLAFGDSAPFQPDHETVPLAPAPPTGVVMPPPAPTEPPLPVAGGAVMAVFAGGAAVAAGAAPVVGVAGAGVAAVDGGGPSTRSMVQPATTTTKLAKRIELERMEFSLCKVQKPRANVGRFGPGG